MRPIQLKFMLDGIEQGWSPLCEARTADWEEWGVVKAGCVNGGKFHAHEHKALSANTVARCRYEIRSGDLLMSRANTRELLGSVALVLATRPRLLLCDKIYRLRYRRRVVHPMFLAYQLASGWARKQIESAASGASASMQNISQSDVGSLDVLLPPLPTQLSIANFLDRKTAAIDALIAKKERLIELLAEKRAALIHRAVTKGLDPDVPMKDSGVPWIGEIPAHWEVPRVWQLFRLGRGQVMSREYLAENPGPYPVYSSQTADNGVFGEISTFDFEGDYLTWTTDGARAGTVFRRAGRFSCTNVCGTLKPSTNNIYLDFLHLALDQQTTRFVRIDINPKLMNDQMALIKVPVPPIQEQQRIADFIRDSTVVVPKVTRQIEQQLTLLREYRQSLITAAVTGQLDIHDAAA